MPYKFTEKQNHDFRANDKFCVPACGQSTLIITVQNDKIHHPEMRKRVERRGGRTVYTPERVR